MRRPGGTSAFYFRHLALHLDGAAYSVNRRSSRPHPNVIDQVGGSMRLADMAFEELTEAMNHGWGTRTAGKALRYVTVGEQISGISWLIWARPTSRGYRSSDSKTMATMSLGTANGASAREPMRGDHTDVRNERRCNRIQKSMEFLPEAEPGAMESFYQ